MGKGRNWSHLRRIDQERVITEYRSLKPLREIASDQGITTDRVRRVLKMHGIAVLSKAEFYEKLNSQPFSFETDFVNDYNSGVTLYGLQRKYKIGMPKVNAIISRNKLSKRHQSEALSSAWANGKRKPCGSNKHGSRDIYGLMFTRWRKNAIFVGRSFTITIDYLQGLLEKQDYRCAYTGVEMKCPKSWNEYHYEMRRDWRLISLDRIDSEIGYVSGNVHFVTTFINKAKGTIPHGDFQLIWAVISEALKRQV